MRFSLKIPFLLLCFAEYSKGQETLRSLILLDSYEYSDKSMPGKNYRSKQKTLVANFCSVSLSKKALAKSNPSKKGNSLDSLALLFSKELTCLLKADTLQILFPANRKDQLKIKYFEALNNLFFEGETDRVRKMYIRDGDALDALESKQWIKMSDRRRLFFEACHNSSLLFNFAFALRDSCKKKIGELNDIVKKHYPDKDSGLYILWTKRLEDSKTMLADSGSKYYDHMKKSVAFSLYSFVEHIYSRHAAKITIMDSLFATGTKKAEQSEKTKQLLTAMKDRYFELLLEEMNPGYLNKIFDSYYSIEEGKEIKNLTKEKFNQLFSDYMKEAKKLLTLKEKTVLFKTSQMMFAPSIYLLERPGFYKKSF